MLIDLFSREATPDCPFQTINDNYNFGSCVVSYSYDRYLCGPGDAAIYNFQITGTSQYCHFYKILVTDNYNDGDLIDYQKYYTFFAAFILSDIEDNLFNFMPPGAGGNSTVISYIPNLCSVVCQSNSAREECGEEYCIRYVFHQESDNSRITFVQSTGECGGTVATCVNPPYLTGDCQNHNCENLELYR